MGLDSGLIVIVLTGLVVMMGWLLVMVRRIHKGEWEETRTRALVNQVFGEVAGKVVEQTKSVLSQDKEAIYRDNAHKKDVIERMIADLKKELAVRQDEIRSLEKDRNTKFGEISKAIEEHRHITQELKTSTEALARVLSNNQQRGEWGERIIEDILTAAGLIESVHYWRQRKLAGSEIKPDITLLLPNERMVAVDVKFPYSEIQKMATAATKEAKQAHKKTFGQDVRAKIKQIEKYIDVEHGTLDYAIMFVPNEMLFSYINQQFPDVVDEAMSKKVMLVSPFTFLIVARTVMEAYKNFMVENNLRAIIGHIEDFSMEWERFAKEFDQLDVSIGKVRETYDAIRGTRYKRMGLRLKRVREYQLPQAKAALPAEKQDDDNNE